MSLKKLSDEISQEVETQVIQSIKGIHEQQMPFLLDLAVKERMRLSKLGPRFADFVDTSFRHANTCPQFLPNFVMLDEFTKDMNLRDSLLRIREEVRILDKKLRDTIMVAKSETYQSARLFYNTVKAAAREKEEGAELIVKDLAAHHKRKSNGNGTEDDSGNGTENDETSTTEDVG